MGQQLDNLNQEMLKAYFSGVEAKSRIDIPDAIVCARDLYSVAKQFHSVPMNFKDQIYLGVGIAFLAGYCNDASSSLSETNFDRLVDILKLNSSRNLAWNRSETVLHVVTTLNTRIDPLLKYEEPVQATPHQ